MDFVLVLPKTLVKYGFIWVIMDRPTKSAYFIIVQVNYNATSYPRFILRKLSGCIGSQYLLHRIGELSLPLSLGEVA